MIEGKIVSLFNDILGPSRKTARGNYAYECPFCMQTKGKKKLELHPIDEVWHCWVCGTKGGRLMSLLKQMKADGTYFKELAEILPNRKYKFLKQDDEQQDIVKQIKLPLEYKPLYSYQSGPLYQYAMDYLIETRGITRQDIFKYRIGYSEAGKYQGMIIIPNYNSEGKLNYFTTRRFFGNPTVKFLNPPIGRGVVGFEMQLNWNLPIILMESALDAITVRRNASPLYGSELTDAVKRAIFLNDVKQIYIMMDPDAMKKALKYSEYLMGYGIDVQLVELPDGTDANQIGYDECWNHIQSTEISSSYDIFEKKLLMNLG